MSASAGREPSVVRIEEEDSVGAAKPRNELLCPGRAAVGGVKNGVAQAHCPARSSRPEGNAEEEKARAGVLAPPSIAAVNGVENRLRDIKRPKYALAADRPSSLRVHERYGLEVIGRAAALRGPSFPAIVAASDRS